MNDGRHIVYVQTNQGQIPLWGLPLICVCDIHHRLGLSMKSTSDGGAAGKNQSYIRLFLPASVS